MKVLVINPGSTSTKLAVYEDEKELFSGSRSYSREVLGKFESLYDQLDLRVEDMLEFLKEHHFDPKTLDGIAARGGMLPPVHSGAYEVDDRLVHALRYECNGIHASNLGGLMAHVLTERCGVPAWIYDAVSTDEMIPEVRPSGLKGWDRKAFSHALNTRAVAMRHAKAEGRRYEDVTYVLAHLGGGISLNIQSKGRVIDTIAGQEGPFSTERAGALDMFDCCKIAEEKGIDYLRKLQIGEGGFASYLGTNNALEVAERARSGDEEAALLMRAMGLQVAKYIALLSADVCGEVDAILLTGGMAHWKELCAEIIRRVSFIAPVHVYAGEFEMQALSQGILRVLKGEEKARRFGQDE